MKVLPLVCFGVLTGLCAWGFVACCCKLKSILSTAGKLSKATAALPVLTTDDEISEALKGEPKIYLIKDYAFTDGETVNDTALDVLKGEYLCIQIEKETYTHNRWHGKSSSYWKRERFADIRGKFRFNNGVSFEIPEGVKVEFPLIAYSRLKKDDLKYDNAEKFATARYYPSGLKLDLKSIKEKFNNPAIRYAFAYMKTGEKATFAARIGDGIVDLNVLDGQNVVKIGGADASFINMSSSQMKSVGLFVLLLMGLMTSLTVGLMFLVMFIDQFVPKQ